MDKMVIINEEVQLDLYDCVYALMYPKYNNRPNLTEEEALSYRDDIVDFIYSLTRITNHKNTVFEDHKKYGDKVVRYDRNTNTQYYIIYNIDVFGNIYINRLLTNHVTKQ